MISRRGVFPGSFNPLTIAHLDVAQRARSEYRLDSVDLVVSQVALDKPAPPGPSFNERMAILEGDVAEYDWLHVRVTNQQLIADIADGYDVVIMGADKWEQVNDVRYYADHNDRDRAVARLPTVVVAERSGLPIDGERATVLQTPPGLHDVSSTAARGGDRAMMAPLAQKRWHEPPTIRRVEAHEVELACSIYLRSRHSAVPAVPPSIHPDDAVHRWFRDVFYPAHEVFFAEVDGQPVSMLGVAPGWIEQLYVLAEFTGRSVGSALVDHAKTLHNQLDLWTFQSNVGARRFYERHGFVEIDRTDGDNEERSPDIRFRWVAS